MLLLFFIFFFFFDSRFNYTTLVWMCHSRTLNNKIHKLHEKCLILIYDGKTLSFQKFLYRDSSVSIHMKNMQTPAITMYKVFNIRGDKG